jgi:hypothetical protein
MKTQSARIAVSIASSLILVAAMVADAGARGGRGGGGYSRSGAAASGSFSASRSTSGGGVAARQAGATQRSGQRAQTQQTASRQAGATERSGQRADMRTARQEERTEREGQRQQGQTERTEARQQGQTERTEARSNAAQNISNDWDHHHDYDDDDDWGYALAGAAVGATLGYVAGAATASPTYVTVLPCSPTVVATGGVSYYGCGGTWYNQAYVNGSVTYVTVNPPLGY